MVLIDPDRLSPDQIKNLGLKSQKAGVDGFLIGSSLLLTNKFDKAVKELKDSVTVPVIIFPGNAYQVSRYADAILFLSLVSGRNPQLLIGEQVKAAPLVKDFEIEPIPTGYLIIESGRRTAVLYMSNTQPIPKDKPDIACAHALAAQYLGMKFIFLEAGSGAENPVPDEIIKTVKDFVSIPIITGGGVKTPQQAKSKVESGASFVVVGNALEKNSEDSILCEFAEEIHWKK